MRRVSPRFFCAPPSGRQAGEARTENGGKTGGEMGEFPGMRAEDRWMEAVRGKDSGRCAAPGSRVRVEAAENEAK